METVLIFLANAIANGAIGHYVSKGLGQIDKDLPILLEQDADIKDIEKLVIDKGIETKVIEFANKTFDNSIILPSLNTDSITNNDKTELFLNFLKLGMELSFRLKVDFLLPSSFVSKNSFTLFSQNKKGVPSLKSTGVRINIEKAAIGSFSNNLYIIPVATESEKEEIWNDYLTNLLDLRKETEKYLKIDKTSSLIQKKMGHCEVSKVTSGACYFRDFIIMEKDIIEQLNIKDKKLKSIYWFESLKEMTEGMSKIMEQQFLATEEVDKIRKAYEHIQDILENHIE